jgi:eukaryotic-like serine/threonine-protein kinase
MPIATGTKLGRYEIRSKIGAGGMGEVYLAEDTRLHRKVALKVLPAELAENKDRMRRFEQEATAAAALNHPNIAHIYEIGESDGVNFIAMEFVDGETLGEKIRCEKSELKVLLKYVLQVAEGLAKAHGSGIVHRDLKPDNIMITRDGHAKILDFGLAKLLETKPESTEEIDEAATAMMPVHSMRGFVMGTIGYMSPEQAQAKPVDQRSDIFSFGCLLYEVTTGRKPFVGDSTIDTLHKIIYGPAPSIADLNPSASPELQRVIRKCLAKEPEKRYQTIRDTANDLEELIEELKGVRDIERLVAPPTSATGAVKSGERHTGNMRATESTVSSAQYLVSGIKQHKIAAVLALVLLVLGATGLGLYLHARNTEAAIESIAVLPFENQNHDPNTDYLSDGVTENIINSLAQLPNLKVIARSSVFRYKGKETNPFTVGQELGVRAILTGRIMQRGDTVIVSTELIDVRDNKQLWGEQYNGKISDLMSLPREIAAEITSNLRLTISGEEHNRMMKHYTENPEAYQSYLKGRYFWNKRTPEGLKKSIEYFQQAVDLDPTYALAYSGMAEAYVIFPNFSIASPRDSAPKAKAAAERALELDETLAEAHTALAYVLLNYYWDFPEANREFQRAIALNPNYATAHQWYGNGYLLAIMGRFDEAIAEGKRALELDPLSLIVNSDLGQDYYFARQFDKAIEQLRKNVEIDPSFYMAHANLGMAYEAKGSFQEALAEYKRARELSDDPMLLARLGHALAASGQRAQALETLDQLSEISKRRYVAAYSFTIIYAGLSEKEQALQWLERSYQDREPKLTRLKVDPLLDPLRSDPRFADLVRRVGLP